MDKLHPEQQQQHRVQCYIADITIITVHVLVFPTNVTCSYVLLMSGYNPTLKLLVQTPLCPLIIQKNLISMQGIYINLINLSAIQNAICTRHKMHFLIFYCRRAPHGVLSLLFGRIMKRFSRDRKSTEATLAERERSNVANSNFHNSVGGIF